MHYLLRVYYLIIIIITAASIMTTLIQTFTQPFYHATCPLKPSPPPSPPICPITISYSGDRATTRSKMPGLDAAHERELFYITSSILQITKSSAVILRLAENYLNRITPLITQLRAHSMTEQAGHVDCCWTLASLASPSSTQPLSPLPSCESSHPPLFPNHDDNDDDNDEHPLPHPSSVTLPLRLDANGRLSPDVFTQPCHTCDPAALGILLDRPVMTLTAALLLAAKTVNESGFWLRRIAHTTVQNIDELKACERALLRALAWHTTYVPVRGVDSPAVTQTLGVRDGRAPAADLAPVLGEAPTYYQCIPWMLWQYTAHAHAPAVHAAIAAAFMRPCSFVPKDAQREILEHLAWLSRTVSGALLPAPAQWEHVVERKRLDLLVGVVQVVERPPLVPIPIPSSSPAASAVGPVRFRRVSSAARRRDSRMLKHVVDIVLKKPKRSRSVDAL